MHFRQQRRRRILPEEAVAAETATVPARTTTSRSKTPVESYTAQARRDEQPRIVDLLPVRVRVLSLLVFLGAVPPAVLLSLYAHVDLLGEHLGRPALPALDLASRGSLGAWYSSLVLMVTAAVAVLLYTLRQHRVDDYRGRYRVWITAAVVWFVLAVNQTSHLDDLLRAVLDFSGRALGGAPAWLWPGACVSIAVAIAARLSFEVRRSKAALALTWLAAGGWFAGSGMGSVIECADPELEVLLAAGLRMFGQLTLLLAHVVYARHVLLDAHGLLPNADSTPKRTRTARRKSVGEGAETARPAARTDLDPPSIAATHPAATERKPAPAAATAAKPASVPLKPAKDDEDDRDEDDADDARGLSRAERKRLRRQQRSERREAA